MKFYAKYFMSLKDPIDIDNRVFTIQHTQRFFYRIEVHKPPPPFGFANINNFMWLHHKFVSINYLNV